MAGVCHDLAYDFPVAGVGLFSFVLAVIQLLTLLLIIGWILRQKKLAQSGMENAAKALILPVYTWILVVFAIASGVQAIINILFPMKVNDYGRSPDDVYLYSAVYAVAWAVYHFIIEGIALFLCQHGAGIMAVRRTAVLAGAWASLTGIIHFFATSSSDHFLTLVLAISWEGSLILFYLLLWGLPLTLLFRRPAVYNFAMFWIIFRSANIASNVLQYERVDAGNCLDIFNTWMFFGVLKPFVVYRTLLMDSQYWFGIAVHAGSKKGSSDSPRKSLYVPPSAHSVAIKPAGSHSPNLSSVGSGDMTPDALSLRISVDPALGSSPPSGSSFPNPTSYISPPRLQQPHSPTDPFRDRTDSYNVMSPLLGQQLDPTAAREIAVGMDALRNDVQVINFAYLSLGKRYQILGAGGTARVYKGKYKGQPVAIKMIYCMDLTPAIISNFYDEAVILSSLRHPNVVNLIGVCVSPPSLCLVMELCDGNLYEFLHGVPSGRVRGSQASSHRGGHGHDLDWGSKLIMALGCARGIAKLHAQNPIIVHRDIKSLNFLVTNDLGVKICDFEWSRPQHRYGSVDPVIPAASARLSSLSSSHSSNAFSAQSDRVPDTLNWAAPETVSSGLCTEKSDIYSLGIVLWELFTGRVPFDDPDAAIGGGRQQVLRSILARDQDYHPPLSAELPPAVRELLADMWRKEPGLRPSAQHVVDKLVLIHKSIAQL